MGVSWGRMRWSAYRRPHEEFQLSHLDPFEMKVCFEGTKNHPAMEVDILVGFGMHCFTRAQKPTDSLVLRYEDDRERRSFDEDRWNLSFNLRAIVESLPKRKVYFAKDDNFVCIDVGLIRYGVFFNIMRLKSNQLLLIVQSAYELDPNKSDPGHGTIHFNAIIGHALRKTKPRRP